KSPSGNHVYLEHPGWPVPTLNGKAAKWLGKEYPGLDIKGDGGYVIFAGQNERGEYQQLVDPLEPYPLTVLPDEVRRHLGLLTPPQAQSEPTEPWVPMALSPTRALRSPPHQRPDESTLVRYALELASRGRNSPGFWLALQLRDNGYSESEAESAGH